jgi:hypothetical protein
LLVWYDEDNESRVGFFLPVVGVITESLLKLIRAQQNAEKLNAKRHEI